VNNNNNNKSSFFIVEFFFIDVNKAITNINLVFNTVIFNF